MKTTSLSVFTSRTGAPAFSASQHPCFSSLHFLLINYGVAWPLNVFPRSPRTPSPSRFSKKKKKEEPVVVTKVRRGVGKYCKHWKTQGKRRLHREIVRPRPRWSRLATPRPRRSHFRVVRELAGASEVPLIDGHERSGNPPGTRSGSPLPLASARTASAL